MDQFDAGEMHARELPLTYTAAEVGVLAVEEEALVEPSERVEE
jgi:hypothetical protein